jgi:hypothetical protein
VDEVWFTSVGPWRLIDRAESFWLNPRPPSQLLITKGCGSHEGTVQLPLLSPLPVDRGTLTSSRRASEIDGDYRVTTHSRRTKSSPQSDSPHAILATTPCKDRSSKAAGLPRAWTERLLRIDIALSTVYRAGAVALTEGESVIYGVSREHGRRGLRSRRGEQHHHEKSFNRPWYRTTLTRYAVAAMRRVPVDGLELPGKRKYSPRQ